MPVVTVKRAVHACCPAVLKPSLARIESSEIGYGLAKGAFWSLVGTAASRVLALAARVLGKNDFGGLSLIQSTTRLFGTFAGFGSDLTATKQVPDCRTKDPERAGRILRMSGLMPWFTGGLAAPLAVLAPWLARIRGARLHFIPDSGKERWRVLGPSIL